MARKRVYDDSEAYVGLAIAICERAANDYRLLSRRSAVGWWDAGWQELEKRRIEDFFLGPFGNLLAFGKGAEILNTLREEEARL